MAGARESVLSLARSEGVSAAYLGGALTAGLGTPMSDVDAFFVVEGGALPAARQVYVGSRRIDIGYQSLDSLGELVARSSRFRAKQHDLGTLNEMGRKSLTTLVRFLLSDVVLDDGSLRALAATAEESLPEIVRTIVGAMSLEVQNALEDAHGFQLVGDLPAAAWAAQLSFLSAAEALLAARGDLYLGQKWVWARWERSLETALALPLPIVPSPDPVVFAESAAVCQDLVIQAITGTGYPVVRAVAPGDLSRAPLACAVPLEDSALVYLGDGDAAEVSRQGLLLLGLAHGRSRARAVELTARLLHSEQAPVAESEVAAYLDSFIDAGLLTAKA
ncbi:hypothetical protein OG455_06200 [Kitasatospora sp. NBC_01287]|uniref:hypothetical protein n=1 Tax=Kitasatospora sp. NBC_01287 TaxID=2903573 RepID=UPI002254C786|nr:hypothetical protein [Kitasatospora sp. NBC_01287]MCX4745121.1 hypothetical protein [Kitasatospora sp. NBC_01287]